MRKPHKSDSTPQKQAENEIRKKLERQLGIELETGSIKLGRGVRISVDAFSESKKLLYEVNSGVGRASSQRQKVMSDALKLLFVQKERGGKWQKTIIFTDKDALANYKQRWQAAALKIFDVKLIVVEPSGKIRKLVASARRRQRMTNA